MRRVGSVVLAQMLALVLAGCTAGSPSGPSSPPTSGSTPATAGAGSSPRVAPSATSPAGQPARGWPTYHGSNDRAGVSAGPALRSPLRIAWSRALDGAVYGQPIEARGIVIAATENNTVYALAANTGRMIWRRHLGPPVPRSALPCGNIDPLGITGTPAYDART